MNQSFNTLLKNKGFNQKRLSEAANIPPGVLCHRINSLDDWRWPEVCRVCEALNITFEEFAQFYPCGTVRRARREPTREERIDNVLAELRAILV